jgi:hypothetical protein
MDFLKNLSSGSKEQQNNEESSKGSGGLFGHLNSALGGGESGEKKEGQFGLYNPIARL